MQEDRGEQLVAVDLHVHTPASNCYKMGESENKEDEYIKLLEKYISKKIKVIAVTDHNSIKGYRYLVDLKNNAVEKLKHLEKFNHLDEIKNEIQREKYKLSLFDNIEILPGIEFEANPGIHILLIFNPNVDINNIEEFLINNGYPKENQGIEKTEISTKSTIEIINSAKDLGAITIAAHIDSDKGALNSLPKGQSRAQFLRSENLMAIQVVSLSTIEYLKELYKHTEYKRKELPAFIRCSDFHNNKSNIEDYVTYMKLSDLTFESIKDALQNSAECLSFTEHPENEVILKNIVDQEETLILKKLNDESKDILKQYVCGILNEGKGNIVIGVGEGKFIQGIKNSKEDIHERLKSIFENFNEYKAFFRYSLNLYDYGNHTVVSVRIKSIKSIIYSLNGAVYLKKNSSVIVASPTDLIKIGESNFKERFKYINERNKKIIDKINKELYRIKTLEENINLYIKIQDSSLKLVDVVNIEFIDPTIDDHSIIKDLSYGDSSGNIYYIDNSFYQEPHSECYLRVTCPTTMNKLDNIESQIYTQESVLISLGGLTYYIEGGSDYKIATSVPIIKIDLKDEFKSICSLKCIVAWLKSPILHCLLDLIHGSFNFFRPKMLKNIPILMNDIISNGSMFEELVNQIIKKEAEILDKINFVSQSNTNADDLIEELLSNHNYEVSRIAIKIEQHIKKSLGINDQEELVINDFVYKENWEDIFIGTEEEEAFILDNQDDSILKKVR